jgi:hypothetical protein
MEGDIRDGISIGKLVKKSDGPEETLIMETMSKYGMEKREEGRVSLKFPSNKLWMSTSNSLLGYLKLSRHR